MSGTQKQIIVSVALLLFAATLASFFWLRSPKKISVGPLGDERPLASLLDHCYEIANGKEPSRKNYATQTECKTISKVCSTKKETTTSLAISHR
ncbi:hypothetical protein DLM45_14545 [Hyphomicrobium methylovorum]|uniref:hypothetical protein n=1 Tax=Hyphomicrobium methylovorum TaxID=84 RepID=UPI0015E670AF|nr:hypothetical protein [Hyphomicrobium methylovorum]MBA2127430.1 hypothetical protein [Hyphomicrobium methylovorum]